MLKLQGEIRYDISNTKTYALGLEGTESYHPPLNKNFTNFSASVGATYYPNHFLILRANFAKAFRTPNLSELTSNGVYGNRYEVGNSNLAPQNAFETDFSLHLHGALVSFDFALFYNQINDYIFLLPTEKISSSGFNIYQFSQTNAALYGGESGFHIHPKFAKWLHFKTSYSMVIGKQTSGDYLPTSTQIKI